MSSTRPTVGILGFGAFGRLAATLLSPHAALRVHDPRLSPGGDGVGFPLPEACEPVTLEEAAAADWVVIATPVQAMEGTLRAIAPHVRPGAVVADVGSVKTLPVRWMLEHLPEHAGVLGTHPMFGPETARERGGVADEPIVLCRARVDDERYAAALELLGGRLGLRVIELTADEHDREAALVQGVTHLIGHAAREMALPDLATGTLAYRRLLQMKRNTERDSPELFEAIQRLNPHAAAVRKEFLAALIRTVERADPGGGRG